MHRNVLLFFAALLYYALATYALYSFQSGLLVTSLVLYGLPAYALARYSAAPGTVLVAVATFGTGMTILLEGVAHIYGMWYTLGVEELRLFGLIPVEVFLSSILQMLFLVLLYELFFDDGEYTAAHARVRFAAFGVFCLSVLGLIALHHYVLHTIFVSHSYLWILGILVLSTLASLAIHKTLSIRFFDKIFAFSLVSWLPLLCGLILAVANTHKLFANVHDYLFTFTLFSEHLPLEELVLTLVIPLFVATFYELYLDDAR